MSHITYSGTVAIWAQKDGDYIYRYFSGTESGLQAAIDSLNGGKGTVYIGPGTLEVTAPIWLPSYCHLKGSGPHQTILKRASTSITDGDSNDTGMVLNTGVSSAPYASNASGTDISISDLTVDGNYSAFTALTNTGLIPCGIEAWYVDGLRIRNVRVQNTLADGFRIKFCRNVFLDEIETDTTGQWTQVAARNAVNFIGDYGASGGWGYNYNLRDASLITTGNGDLSAEAIQCSGIVGVIMDSIFVDGCDYVFESDTTASATPTTWGNWSISNVVAVNVLFNFINLGTLVGGTLENVSFSRCTFKGHATLHDGGVAAFSTTSGHRISRFTMTDCTVSNINTKDTTRRHWIDIQPGDTTGFKDFLFSNCVFSGKNGSVMNNSTAGINFRGACTNFRVENVILRDVPGVGCLVNDTTVVPGGSGTNIRFVNVIVDTATDRAFAVRADGASANAAHTNIEFINCTAKDCCTQNGVSGFWISAAAAGGSITKVKLIGCRAYKTSGTTLTHGLLLNQSSGTLDDVEIAFCDFDGTATGWFSLSGTHTNVKFHDYSKTGTVASAASITLPQGDFIEMTGTSDVTSITPWFVWDQRVITIKFTGTAGVSGLVDGGNLKLASTLAYTPDDTISLRYRKADALWYEVSRSVN